MSWLSSFVRHNKNILAPVVAAIPFVGPSIAHAIDRNDPAGQTAAASEAAAQAAAAQATATQLAANAVAANASATIPAQRAILATSPPARMTLWYVGGGLLVLLVLVLLFRKR